VAQLASVIAQMNGAAGPDFLGICEVENRFVIDLLGALSTRQQGKVLNADNALLCNLAWPIMGGRPDQPDPLQALQWCRSPQPKVMNGIGKASRDVRIRGAAFLADKVQP
jgi:hypothetical protein